MTVKLKDKSPFTQTIVSCAIENDWRVTVNTETSPIRRDLYTKQIGELLDIPSTLCVYKRWTWASGQEYWETSFGRHFLEEKTREKYRQIMWLNWASIVFSWQKGGDLKVMVDPRFLAIMRNVLNESKTLDS